MPDPEQHNNGLPEETGRQESVARRTLVGAGIGLFGAGYTAAIGYPVYRYLNTPVERAAGLAAVTQVTFGSADIPAPGSAKMFMFGTRPAMLIHHEDGSWTALDAVCTHLGCTVKYEPEKKRIFCACHGGVYDPATGDAVAGPPPKGLTRFQVEVKDDEVIVARG
jgi:cytochrome b6-f complex iron-sulfur subunit